MTELSEYEKKRLENIKQNQQVLRSLNIPKLPSADLPIRDKRFRAKDVSVKREKVDPEPPSRRSSRLIERQTGVAVLETEPRQFIERKERAPKVPRVTSRVTFAPQIGACSDFTECFKEILTCGSTPACSICPKFETQNEHCVLKVARDRIYSMAVHPASDRVIACAGTKEGELSFWDAGEVLEASYSVSDAWHPKSFIFAPHNASLSNLRYRDHHTLLTTSYDGSCLSMDIQTGTFTPWFHMDSKSDVVTGFELSRDSRTAYHSDTAGMVRMSDLVGGKVVQEVQLHGAKIGGLSLSSDGHTLATCSNDRTIALWDVRNLKSQASLSLLHYKNAVTAVNFHPTVPTCYVSTCYDDHLRIHSSDSVVDIPHNNQTGRWITLFKAIWDPKSTAGDSLVAIANMGERGVDLYGIDGAHLCCATSPWLTAQPAVNAFHPVLNVMVSGNASGKMTIWKA